LVLGHATRQAGKEASVMKRILAVVGSPRKNGNTHILVSKVVEGARERGAVVDELLLGESKIEECDGCHRCWQGKECARADDMRDIYPTIGDSDAIIFGTPVYWYGPTGLMKMFLDRFVYFNCPENREKVRGKRAVLAVPFEEENLETARLVVEMFEKSLGYLEMELAGKVLVPGVSAKGDILHKPERLEEAFKLGQSLV
jgi:multimeric flavodoxin WrbA